MNWWGTREIKESGIKDTNPIIGAVHSCSHLILITSQKPHLLCHSVTKSCLTPCDPTDCRVCSNSCPLSQRCYLTISSSVIPFSSCLLSFPAAVSFSSQLTLPIRLQKYWSFSSSISPSNEYSGLISFRIDWFDLLAVQGTLKSLLQHHSLKASILWHSAFFMVQLSHLSMATRKTIA